MSKPEAWVPFRWQSGPLETALLKAPSAEAAAVHRSWNDPATLNLLKGSPINCIVVTWAGGRPEDGAQQESLKPLIAAAHAQGLAVAGRISGDVPAGFVSAKDAALDAVIADRVPEARDLPVVAATKIDDFNPAGDTSVIALAELPWPQIPNKPQGGSGGENAGPTGNPWIDSNGWAVQLCRASAPERTPWVLAEPPLENRVLSAESYLLAVADAYAAGARWPVALDRDLRGQLAAGDQRALKTWQRIVDAISFFEPRRTQILAQRTIARLGVCSDFRGDNAYLSTEFLNLASRRWLPYRILEQSKTSPASLEGLKGVIWIDDKAPRTELAKTLAHFASTGGLLILPASVAHFADGLKPFRQRDPAYSIYTKGDGRVAVARQLWGDPFALAAEAHMLLSRRYDVLRLFNAGLSAAWYTEGGSRDLVQIVNFVGRTWGHPTSVYVARTYRAARYYALDAPAGKPMDVIPRDNGIELKIPSFKVYAAVELEG